MLKATTHMRQPEQIEEELFEIAATADDATKLEQIIASVRHSPRREIPSPCIYFCTAQPRRTRISRSLNTGSELPAWLWE